MIIANRTVTERRGPIAGYSAQERASATMQRIEQALETEPKLNIAFEDADGGTRLLLAGKHPFRAAGAGAEGEVRGARAQCGDAACNGTRCWR